MEEILCWNNGIILGCFGWICFVYCYVFGLFSSVSHILDIMVLAIVVFVCVCVCVIMN